MLFNPKGVFLIQPITGAFLAKIRNIEKDIRAILSQNMPESYTDRPIGYEWCNATTYGGICRNHQDRDPFTGELHETALVRYSTCYDITPDIIAHEILHALLPFRTGHGRLAVSSRTRREETSPSNRRANPSASNVSANTIEEPPGPPLCVPKARGFALEPTRERSPNEEKEALTGFYLSAKAFPLRGLS